MARAPDDRYPTALAFRNALVAAVGAEDKEAFDDSDKRTEVVLAYALMKLRELPANARLWSALDYADRFIEDQRFADAGSCIDCANLAWLQHNQHAAGDDPLTTLLAKCGEVDLEYWERIFHCYWTIERLEVAARVRVALNRLAEEVLKGWQ